MTRQTGSIRQTNSASSRRRPTFAWRHWKAATCGAVGVVVALVVTAFAIAWYYSSALEDEALAVNHDPERFDLRVREAGNGVVTMETTERSDPNGLWQVEGTFGITWPGGYARIASIREVDRLHVVREFTLMNGSLAPGTMVRMDTFAFPDDPWQGLGIAFDGISIDGPLGSLPAWFIDAPGDTWAVLVHGGEGSSRRDMLRPLQPIHAAGLKALVISYRNDEGAPVEADGHVHFGETEWQDVDAAASYAIAHGAERLVLVGHSMGGAIVMSFLVHSNAASRVSGVILDSPVLDFYQTVRWRARNRAPGPIIAFGLWASGLRFGIDWNETNYLARTDRLAAPMLVFHGTGDQKVQVETSEQLARLRPDLVTLISLPGVGHVRSWNADPATYNATVTDFIGKVGPLAD